MSERNTGGPLFFRLSPVARAALLCVALASDGAQAQSANGAGADSNSHAIFRGSLAEATVGSELETYLRVLQLEGIVPLTSWTIRELSPRTLARLAPRTRDPWSLYRRVSSRRGSVTQLQLIRPQLRAVYNSDFPFGLNDGPVWAGRGLTASLSGGFAVSAGPFSMAVDPVVFVAQNRTFTMLDNGFSDARRFANGQHPKNIDLPQRFGPSRYARFDLGESSVRLEVASLSAGISTASQWWGPALVNPLVLGNNAGGFPHLFVESADTWNVGIGRLRARAEIGILDQSDWSPVAADSGRRRMAGIVASFIPRGIPGLELGASRFYHRKWDDGPTLSDFKILFTGFTSGAVDYASKYDPSSPNFSPDNQLASVFARWAHPPAGIEVYGELLRSDRNFDVRDLILEPDHDATYMLGFQKTWHDTSKSRILALHGEVVNSTLSHLHRVRVQSWPYVHSPIYQGHTQRGQALGSMLVEQGGAGSVLALDWYSPAGRSGLQLMRISNPRVVAEGAPTVEWDAKTVLSADMRRFEGHEEWFARGFLIWETNRNFDRPAMDVGLATGIRASWW